MKKSECTIISLLLAAALVILAVTVTDILNHPRVTHMPSGPHTQTEVAELARYCAAHGYTAVHRTTHAHGLVAVTCEAERGIGR